MKITNIFSSLGLAFRSIFSNKRRSISIGAGMILGAAIFSSIFFYGSMINSITVQDIIDNTEAEIAFAPISVDPEYSPEQFANMVTEEVEIEDSIVLYGGMQEGDDSFEGFYDSQITPEVNFTEYSGVINANPFYTPFVIDDNFLNNSIVNSINMAGGENDLSGNNILLSIDQYKSLGIQLNDTLLFNFTIYKWDYSGGFDNTEILETHMLNLTIKGFFRNSLLLGNQFLLMGSHNIPSGIIANMSSYQMFRIASKLNLEEFPLSDLMDLNDAIEQVIRRIEQKYDLEGNSLISGQLFSFLGMITIMQLLDTILYIPAIVLSIILISLGAELALQERKFEVSVLKAQGASPKQIRRMIYSEVFLIAVIGEIIGLFLGMLGAAMVLSTYRFMVIDFQTFASAFTSLNISLWSIIVTVIITFGILFITTRKKTNAFIKQEVAVAKTIDKQKKGWFKAIYGDVIFFVLGLTGVILTVIEDVSPAVSYSFVVELLQFFTPILLWFGGASVVSRLSTKVPEKLDKVLVKVFKDIGSLLKGSLSRRHQNFPRMTVLICLSVSLSVFAAIQGETGSADIPRHADYYFGGDMRVDMLGYYQDLSIANFTGFEDKIESVIPIYYTPLQSGADMVHCYGADLTQYGEEALWHRDSIIGYSNWERGLDTILADPLRNVGIGLESARYLEISDDPTFKLDIFNGSEVEVEATIVIDHAPGGVKDEMAGFAGYAILVDKEFILNYAPFTHTVVRAIINLKPGVDPIEENLSFQFNTKFDWIVDAQSYQEEVELISGREGLRFGFPGLLTINFIISLVAIVIGITIFMFMIINQRKKEFAILIAEGASKQQLVKLVLSEVLSMAIFATGFGTIIGFLFGYQINSFFDTFSVTTFDRYLIFPPIILTATIVGAFLVILLATLIPALIAAKTNVVEEMRTV
ncbi:MAG: ABC transporter permease [Candidatus Heimdallarchaeaceae archaeon]